LKGRKFEQSCISDQLSVSVDIHHPLSIYHIGTSPGVSNEMRVKEGGATHQALGTRRRGHGWREG